MRPASSIRQVNHDFWLDLTKVDACRFVSMTLLLLQKSVCLTQRRGEKHEKIRSVTECSNLHDFCVVFVRLVQHAFCYFIRHVQCRQKPCSFLYRAHLIQNLWLQALMSKILCNQPPQFYCFVPSPALTSPALTDRSVLSPMCVQHSKVSAWHQLCTVRFGLCEVQVCASLQGQCVACCLS